MTLLLIGIVLFGLPHLASIIAPGATRAAKAQLGEKRYKGLYSFVSLLGLILIGWGYARARATAELLYEPWAAGRHVLLLANLVAFVLIFSNRSNGYIARFTHHPFSFGIVLWSLAHLLANSEKPVVWIFTMMLAIGVADIAWSFARGKTATHTPNVRHDLRSIAVGVVVYLLLAFVFHPYVVGIPVMPGRP